MARKRGNNEGSITKRRDGLWQAALTIGRDPATGKVKRLFFYGRTRGEAQAKLEEAKLKLRDGTFVTPNKITLGEWLTRWIEFYVKNNVRVSTYNSYRNAANRHIIPALGSRPLQQLTTAELQEFYARKLENGRLDGRGGLSTRMIHLFHQVISGALKQAVRENLVARNVAEAVKLPRLRYKEMRPLTLEEARRLLAAAKGHRLYPALLLELATGLRRGELFALRWRDVDLNRGLLHVRRIINRVQTPDREKKTALVFEEPKTANSRRTVPIPKDVVAELKAHKARQNEEKLRLGAAYEDNDLVFATPLGRPVDPDNAGKRYKTLLKKAGLPGVRFHDLRHTFATLLLEADEHPKVVQELLGHSRIGVTLDLYTHVRPELKQRAAEKINDLLRAKEIPSVQDG